MDLVAKPPAKVTQRKSCLDIMLVMLTDSAKAKRHVQLLRLFRTNVRVASEFAENGYALHSPCRSYW